MKKLWNMRKAFTLVDLVIIVMIIGILAAILIPRMGPGPKRDLELLVEQYRQVAALTSLLDARPTIEQAEDGSSAQPWGELRMLLNEERAELANLRLLYSEEEQAQAFTLAGQPRDPQ